MRGLGVDSLGSVVADAAAEFAALERGGVRIPVDGPTQVRVNGQRVSAHREAGGWTLDEDVVGKAEIEATHL